MMGRLVDRKSLVSTLFMGARKLLGLAFVLGGLVSLLVYEFGGGQSIWGIDGYSLPNWQVDLRFTLMFWPIGVPICLAIFCQVLILFGRRRFLVGTFWQGVAYLRTASYFRFVIHWSDPMPHSTPTERK